MILKILGSHPPMAQTQYKPVTLERTRVDNPIYQRDPLIVMGRQTNSNVSFARRIKWKHSELDTHRDWNWDSLRS